ncbi:MULTISPECIES: DUF485 domain-containing protein [Streptomyces]|uniref:DUF485 domain-containing protein n=1 Tax=Streptomyces TaxID=1883 RepID=UPI0006F3D9C6|nr:MULTISPECIES: DUF485 domain-containing protein [Streptomyces]KQX84723.1 hypothetical protein ASD26_28405 [Streptomyces sp. Root1319]KQZ12588.1 hypothetical protein ASD51_32690 [Streptomyces sp. Root55]MDX3065764.1 DUF485 domain-containing protein [Streptomyces sp. ND04-05B]RPK74383.1 hypothetical protein EES45_27490 [Streptomyces sp. ADI97-07]WRY81368.1 DUF485 domain-containing protein [Streptomyces clavifer]
MATDAPQPPGRTDDSPVQPTTEAFLEAQNSAEFAELRRSYRSFAFPLTLGFIAWYLLYVLLSSYAGDFMGTVVVAHFNVAFVFGLAQFATTFLIAWLYSRHASTKLDPKAEAIKSRMEADA